MADAQLLRLEPAALPHAIRLQGRLVTLEPLEAANHAASLFKAIEGHDALFDYLFDAPPADATAYRVSLEAKAAKADPFFFAIVDNTSREPIGLASFLRIEPGHRVIEVGNILFTPVLQKTPHATEAMYLMAKHAFEDLGYRRYEWKCNARNAPSRRAALRLGFTFEGIFRRHMIVKGRSRDTAWFAMIDEEWPWIRNSLERWLDPANFSADGTQVNPLAAIRESLADTAKAPLHSGALPVD